jgi:WD40 repeat protein
MSRINSETIFTFKGHFGSIYSLIDGSGPLFYSGSSDKNIVRWNLSTGKHDSFSASLPTPIYSLAMDDISQILIAGTGIGQLHFISLTKKEEIKCIQLTKAILFDLLLFVEQNVLLVAGSDGYLHAIQANSGEILWARKITENKVRQLRKVDDTGKFIAACGDGNFLGFNLQGDLLFKHLAHHDSCNAILAIPQFGLLYSGGKDAHLNVFALDDMALIKSIPAHNFAIYDLAIHPAGQYLASGSRDKTIKIWDAATGNFLLRLENPLNGGHSHSVNRLFWSKYRNLLVSGGDDRQIIARNLIELT